LARPKNAAPAKVEALKHNDMRVNIPTEELRDFVAPDEAQPKKVLYPRDPSLDPQLVWKGKDEQDSHPLAVDAVPIYIQEKIQPQAIIEEVRSQARLTNPDPSQLYSTKSYPFDPPSTGKLAVKVINHYGDEVLKVYDVS
jgi:adenine-specific DNA-methyltransferase